MARDGLQASDTGAEGQPGALTGVPAAPAAPDHQAVYPKGKSVPEGYWAGGAVNELRYWRRRAETAEARCRELVRELEAMKSGRP